MPHHKALPLLTNENLNLQASTNYTVERHSGIHLS